MSEIIHAFGIDWRLIVIQMFNFTLLAGLLWYFLYTPVLKIISERQQRIEKGILDAYEAEQARKDADTKKKEVVAHAEAEADAIVVRATEYGKVQEAELLSNAQKKAAESLKAAREAGEDIKRQAQKESEAEIAKLAILAAEKLVREKTAQ